AQKFWKDAQISICLALSQQGRRLFEFPLRDYLLQREGNKTDYEFNFTLQKNVLRTSWWQLSAGIGYAEFHNTFTRPFDHRTVLKSKSGFYNEFLHWYQAYTISKLIVPVSGRLFLAKNERVFLNMQAVPAFSFRKGINHIGQRFVKWELEWNGFELYPGVGFTVHPRVQLAFQYRWLYRYKIDEVIFYDLLFDQRGSADFLQKKYDDYNPVKYWFTLSYALARK
ncbi:MAG: hypothetical protein KDD04_03375, partial [Sinomicrobium sp.]|nr:hypothetical protein [Sinomicrobium sp.]